MPFCPTCKGIGKVIDQEYKMTTSCPDCHGRGIVSDNMLKFMDFYARQKEVEKEISSLENDEQFVEQYHEALDK